MQSKNYTDVPVKITRSIILIFVLLVQKCFYISVSFACLSTWWLNNCLARFRLGDEAGTSAHCQLLINIQITCNHVRDKDFTNGLQNSIYAFIRRKGGVNAFLSDLRSTLQLQDTRRFSFIFSPQHFFFNPHLQEDHKRICNPSIPLGAREREWCIAAESLVRRRQGVCVFGGVLPQPQSKWAVWESCSMLCRKRTPRWKWKIAESWPWSRNWKGGTR